MQLDQPEGKRRGADEESEDPEDDHGRVSSLWAPGFRRARNTTIARPIAISTSPMLYASGSGPSLIQSPRRLRSVAQVMTAYCPRFPLWIRAPPSTGAA